MQAVASAFSEAYLNATNECEPTPCSVDVMVLTRAFGFVLAEATASVLAVQCAGVRHSPALPTGLTPHARPRRASETVSRMKLMWSRASRALTSSEQRRGW